MLNKVILIGNLGRDPEARFTQDGTCVCNVNMATTERFKTRNGERQERTEWHRVVLWGKLGEIANQYLHKGSKVYIEGKIETRKWQDRDGNDRYTTEIRAHEMKMLDGRSEGGMSAAPRPAAQQQPQQPSYQQAAPAAPAASGDPFGDVGDGYSSAPVRSEDVPF